MKSPQQPTPSNGIEAFRAAVRRAEGNQFPPEVVEMVLGQDEQLRRSVIDSANSRVDAAVANDEPVSVYDHYASLGNVQVVDGRTVVMGSSGAHPVRLGKGEKNRRREVALGAAVKSQVEIEGEN